MILFLFSSIFIVSPDSVADENADITVVFEPPLETEEAVFILDGKRISGEFEPDYFYYEPGEPLREGSHKFIAIAGNDTLIFTFRVEKGKVAEKKGLVNYFSIGGGGEFNTAPETLSYTTYPQGRYSLISGDIEINTGNFRITGTYIKDPDYPMGWFGLLDIESGGMSMNGGVINPVYDELTVYSPYGTGLDILYRRGKISLDVIYMKSSAYDTLISEFKRNFLNARINIDSTLILTFVKAEDDTGSFTGIPFELPEAGYIFSGALILRYRELKFYGMVAGSKGVFNMYTPEEVRGISLESGVMWHNFSLYYRRVDSLYLPLGNPYLDKDRRVAIEGSGERGNISFQTSGYVITERLPEIEEYNLSTSITAGKETGISMGFQIENDEGSSSLSGSIGGFLYRSRYSLTPVYTVSWTSGYGFSHSLSGNFYINLSPLVLNASITATTGQEQEISLSFSPQIFISPFQFYVEYRTIFSNGYRENSIKSMLKFIM